MATTIGQKNQVLITGRTAYGFDGTDAYPMSVNTSGYQNVNTMVTETIPAILQASTAIAASTWLKTTEMSVVGVKKVAVFIDHARAATAAFTNPGTEYRLEFSQKATGNDTWAAATTWNAATAVCMSCASSATVAVADTLCVILSGTAAVLNDFVHIPSATAGNDEWWRVAAVSGTANFTILDASVNSHAATTAIFGGGQRQCIIQDVEPFTRMRIVINNNASAGTNPIVARIACITER
jgi:hypothetical protein